MQITTRFSTRLLALGALCAIALPSMAKSGSKMSGAATTTTTKMSKKSTQMTGTVLSMTDTSLTVKPARKANGDSKTVDVPATASVMMGKQKSMLSALKPGEKVTIRMNAMGTVTSIMASAMKMPKAPKASKMAAPKSKM